MRLLTRACALLLAFTALLTVWPVRAEGPVERRVLVIGLDGLERRVVEAMWAEGYLPHLKDLAARGAMLSLATAERSRERPVWTTVATGVPSAVHGIAKNNRSGAGQTARGAGSGERKAPALWTLAHKHGLTSLVADWPATFPAESIAGVILSDRAAMADKANAASPPKVAASLERWGRRASELYGHLFPGDLDGAPSDRLALYATRRALEAHDTDLMMVRLRRVDRTSHRLWKYFEPESYPSARELGWEFEARLFYESYVAVDAAVGELVGLAGPQTSVMVLSAHGFKGISEQTHLKCRLWPVLQHLGHLAMYGGKPEWRKTRLYVDGTPDSDPRKQVRVNLKGREAKGRVKPGDKDALIEALKTELEAFRYAGTLTPVFRFEAPRQGETGDLVVVFNEVGVGPLLEYGDDVLDDAMLDFKRRSGGHGMDTPGLLFATGPGIAPGARPPDGSVLDVAPTVLDWLGVPVPKAFTGKPLEGLTGAP